MTINTRHQLPRRLLAHSVVAAILGLGLLMCSSDDDDGGSGGGGNGNSTSSGGNSTSSGGNGVGGDAATGGDNGNTGGSTSSGGSGTGGLNLQTDACDGSPFTESSEGGGGNEVCTGVGQEAESFPVDMLIVMDRSVSMTYVIPGTDKTRIEALSDAVSEFAQHPDAVDIGAGLVFFRPYEGDQCAVDTYETPDVGIAPLSDSAQPIIDALADASPGNLTPVVPALQGAINHAKEWAASHPDRATVVVLVSDAYPTECDTYTNDGASLSGGRDPATLATIARESFQNEPSVPVYGVAVDATTTLNIDNMARGGGTREAFVANDESIGDDFVDALLNITLSPVSCEFSLPTPPDGEELDYDKVQMIYTTATGDKEEMPYVGALSGCQTSGYGGWYYDNPNDPSVIRVCPCTCARFGAGALEIRIGCSPLVPFT